MKAQQGGAVVTKATVERASDLGLRLAHLLSVVELIEKITERLAAGTEAGRDPFLSGIEGSAAVIHRELTALWESAYTLERELEAACCGEDAR